MTTVIFITGILNILGVLLLFFPADVSEETMRRVPCNGRGFAGSINITAGTGGCFSGRLRCMLCWLYMSLVRLFSH